MRDHVIVRVVAKLLIPYILLFALYTQFHGDYGPGGGFQAGVIFAAGLILHGIVYGLRQTQQVVPPMVLEILLAVGVLIFAGVGVVAMLSGGNFLDYGALDHHDPAHGQHLGLLLIEFGVGVTVGAPGAPGAPGAQVTAARLALVLALALGAFRAHLARVDVLAWRDTLLGDAAQQSGSGSPVA